MFPLDYKKNTNKDEDIARIEELKKKLYATSFSDSAVRERGVKQHHIDIGKNWEETDLKQAQIQSAQEKSKQDAKLGMLNENVVHHGSTLYGHYSPAEDVTHKQSISTAFANKKIKDSKSEEESISSFLSDKFADKRALDTQKRLAVTDIAMQYASAQIQRDIYPDFKKQNINSISQNAESISDEVNTKQIGVQNSEESVIDQYHPDFTILTVGDDAHLNTITRQIKHSTASSAGNLSVLNGSKASSLSPKSEPKSIKTEQKNRFSFGILLFSLMSLFFVGSLGYAYYIFTKGINIVSPDKVEIVVSGPVSVRSGEVSDFSIDITNNNPTDLTLSDLVVQYPYGTMSALDPSVSNNNERIDVGIIKPKQTIRKKVSAIFFGEENVKKNITYSLEFSIPDSSSIFNVKKDVGVIIAGSPITAKITNVKEVTNNQELSFDIEIQSNTQEVVKNVQLQVEYPFGYKLSQANLKPVFDNNTWNFGEIAALDTKIIQIKGKLIGTSNLEKNFRFTLGVFDTKTGEMSTVLSTQDQKVTIEKPFVSTKLSLDGLVQEFKPVQYGDSIQGDIVFTNNLDTPLTDVVVEVSLGGVLIDRTTVKSNKGFYRSSDDIIFWDRAQEESLASINPGESRELSFNMNIIKEKESYIKTLRRSSSNLVITVRAKRLNENRVPEDIKSVINQEIRLETNPAFESGIAFKNGPFQNTGSFPPRVNMETTYTYVGRITNTANTLKQTVFTAKLPPNATWKNMYSKDIPASSVLYSQNGREITINLGEISSGAGITTPAREFAFQVGFTPTLTQLGEAPVLILNPRISGIDSFTGRRLDRSLSDGLTIIPTVDTGKIIDGRVAE